MSDKDTEQTPEVETTEQAAEQETEQAEVTEEVEASPEDAMQAELEKAQAEVQALKEQMLREQAETQNIRKRVQKDVENARKFALEKFVGELLPVVDNLERAIEAVGDDEASQPVREGIELTYKSFLAALEKFQVKQLNPVGEPFDANFHQAMTMVPNPDMEPNSVMDCMQKGYTLNDRLVRAAMVVVSKEV